MKILREIRDYFLPAYSVKYADPENDIKMLAKMVRQTERLINGKTGKRYVYCFLSDDKNLRTAQYLFRRNGVPVVCHKSHYNWSGYEWVLRISNDVLDKDEYINNFINSIEAQRRSVSVPDYDERIKIIKRQRMGYER